MPDSKKILLDVEKLVKPKYDKIKYWAHGWPHILRVVRYSEIIAKKEGVDPILCGIAAFCHDLGRIKEESLLNDGIKINHALMSVEPTKEILKKIGIDGKDFDLIIEAVRVHSDKKYLGENKVALVLQDADRWDGLGAWGVLRSCSWDCKLIFEPPVKNKEEERIKEILPTILNDKTMRDNLIKHTQRCIEWYEDLLNLKSSKELLKQDYTYSKEFYIKLNNHVFKA